MPALVAGIHASSANMPKLKRSNRDIEIRPYVEEAINSLGFVKAEATEWLAEKIVEHQNNSGRGIREEGTRLSKSRREQLGLPPFGDGHLNDEVWSALTDEGKKDPVRNFDDTVSRAFINALNALEKIVDDHFLKKGFFACIEMRPLPDIEMLCPIGRSMVGKRMTEVPTLPFDGCDKRYCRCHWRTLTHWKLDQENQSTS